MKTNSLKDELLLSSFFTIQYIIYIYGNICPQEKDALTICSACADVNSHNKVVVCYVNGWAAAYRRGFGKFLVENIDPMLCTHIIYAFAGLDDDTYSIYSQDSKIDTEENGGLGNK